MTEHTHNLVVEVSDACSEKHAYRAQNDVTHMTAHPAKPALFKYQ